MYATPAEPYISTLFACLYDPDMSQAKPRRESNPILVHGFLLSLRSKSPSYRKVAAISQIMAIINPRFVRKKQGSAGVGYCTLPKNASREASALMPVSLLLRLPASLYLLNTVVIMAGDTSWTAEDM